MPGRHYASVPSRARARAHVGLDAPEPARFYAELARQMLRYGLPAARRGGRVRATVARTLPPARPLAPLLRGFPRDEHPEWDAILAELESRWDELLERSDTLPSLAPQLSALVLPRSAALTLLVFGGQPEPLLVAKLPGDAELLDAEVAALERAAPAGVAPRSLGTFSHARLQEGLPGEAVRVVPLDPDRAIRLEWGREHAAVAAGLERLAVATRAAGDGRELADACRLVAGRDELSAATRNTLAAAAGDLTSIDTSVLEHYDVSPQNCLVQAGALTGLIDWEETRAAGRPGFDAWGAALSFVEHGVGLARWSDDLVVETFARSWRHAPFWEHARRAARACALAGGVPDRLHDQLELAYFAERAAARLRDPGGTPTGPRVALRMLDAVAS